MNKRIKTISSYIEKEDIVLDIGCDMALLGECLAGRGIKSYASDNKKNIILSAQERINKLNLSAYITFYISDGLKNIDRNLNIDTLVLSGLGSYTIINILKYCDNLYKKIIIVSNNNYEYLRKNMMQLGYKIKLEEVILDKEKYYDLIIYISGDQMLTNKELLLGYNHVNQDMYIERNKQLLKKYQKIYKTRAIINKIKLLKES